MKSVVENYAVVGDVIMPNHLHVLIDFSESSKKLNTIIGDGKRFIAYDIIRRSKERGATDTLALLEKAVTIKDRNNGHQHEVWKDSFDWKYCETAPLPIRNYCIFIITPAVVNGILQLKLQNRNIVLPGIIFQENRQGRL